MNIKQNIVRIKTAFQIGSGIIYPCETNEDELGKTKFVIFTNKHLFEKLDFNGREAKLFIELDIYDNKGNLIDLYNDKVMLKVFIPELKGNKTEDIAVMLITFDYKISLDLEIKILWEDVNLNKIFIEGFPQILYDNDISSKIQLQGRYKNIYPSNEKIGVFQILDDYHWYSNYKDLRLFQGFSGSPVYNTEKNSNFIVGMNQSILNIEDGENPFKLLYYYKFKFILEYLREQGCIIFNKNIDNTVVIRWIYQENFNNSKEINLLLLGSSGAGKSSFAKTFLLHSNLIDSTNDGQTTRSNIIYELSLYNKNPKVRIKFLDKKQFILRMTQLNYENYLLQIIKLIDEENSSKSLKEYIQNLYIKNEIQAEIEQQSIKEILFSTEKLSFVEQQKFMDNLYEMVEKRINKYLNQKNIIGLYEKRINEVLLYVEGFFNINEFNFLNSNISLENNVEKIDFIDYFNKFYENIYQQIIGALKENNIVSEKNYSYEIFFNDSNSISKWLPLCLQVKNKKSLTGIIEYVHIFDSISNEYAFILNDLNIKKLKLIDTYGLDHANWEQGKNQVLSNILYDLQDKKIVYFNSDLAVIYIKKLDSGKPTELKSIIPQIYDMIPQAPVYCIFNGLDIFLRTEICDFQSLDYLNSRKTIPKSIEYIISEDGEKDILHSIDSKNYFKKNLYETLKNNIIAFCSDEEKVKKYYNIYENNRKEIYKLLLSISMKEYSSMNIIPQKFIDELELDKYNQHIEEIIKRIFANSSKTDWSHIHWKTRRANYARTSEEKSLGYWGTYEHRWNQLFHRGYVNTITQMKGNLLSVDENVNYISAIDSCIKNMEEHFLGQSYQLVDIKIKSDKDEFRKIIEMMYEKGVQEGQFKSNPFKAKEKNQDTQEDRYLNDVCDFQKGYIFIRNEIIKHFKECLIATIQKDNNDKSENLIKINYNFYSEFQKLKYEFNKKYSNVEFNELLKYYSEKLNN